LPIKCWSISHFSTAFPDYYRSPYLEARLNRILRNNVVDLNNSRLHQSYYTALSRSASAAGTIILQGFDARKITGGASGALRQEFRELEILDDIVRLRYDGKLSSTVIGDRRNTLISCFRKWKGDHYMPSGLHKAIRWGKADPFLESNTGDIPWRILDRTVKDLQSEADSKAQVVTANKTSPVSPTAQNLKRKSAMLEFSPTAEGIHKKLKATHFVDETPSIVLSTPKGTRWRNNSCAYDAVVSSLFAIWLDDPTTQSESFNNLNSQFLGPLANGFARHHDGEFTLDDVRDFIRRRLQRSAPDEFGWGREASVHSVLERVLGSDLPILSSNLHCPNHHPVDRRQLTVQNCLITAGTDRAGSVQEWVDIFDNTRASKCHICDDFLVRKHWFVHNPVLLAFNVSANIQFINHSLMIPINENNFTYKLRGIIYHGESHFTARIITPAGLVWFHDGMTSARMEYDGILSSLDDMCSCRSKSATVAIYAMTGT